MRLWLSRWVVSCFQCVKKRRDNFVHQDGSHIATSLILIDHIYQSSAGERERRLEKKECLEAAAGYGAVRVKPLSTQRAAEHRS